MIHTEIMHHLHVLQAFIYIADHIAFTAYELVAWVNIAIRDDGQIFVACSASSESLRQARAFPEIHIEVEEEERSSFFFTLDEELCEAVVFFLDSRKIGFLDGIFSAVIAYNRFHGNSWESMIEHIFHVGCEIKVMSGESAAYIVFFAVSVSDAVLQILDDLVISAFIIDVRSHAVMHFFSSIEGKNQADMIIGKVLGLFFIKQHAVCCKRHLDLLMMLLFLVMDIVYSLLYDMPVHQRFAAEEIKFAVFSRTAVGNQEIDSSSGYIKAHQHAPLAVSTLAGKAVLAAEVAVMSDIDAESLNDRTVFNRHFIIRVHRSKENFLLDQLVKIIHDLIEFTFFIFAAHIGKNHLAVRSIIVFQNFICHIIDNMNNAAVYIHDDVHIILTKTMNHGLYIIIHEKFLLYPF